MIRKHHLVIVVALQNSEEIREDAMKRAEALEAKLEAAEKALEEARAKAKSEEERWEEENVRLATREAEIRQRLDALSSSLTSKSCCPTPAYSFGFSVFACVLTLFLFSWCRGY